MQGAQYGNSCLRPNANCTGSPVPRQHALHHFLTPANQYVVHRTWLASPRSLVLNPYPKIAGILVHIRSAETRLPRRPGNKISVLGQRWVTAYNGLVACIAPHLAVSSSALSGLLLCPPSIERPCHYYCSALRSERHLLSERDISWWRNRRCEGRLNLIYAFYHSLYL